MIKTLLTLLPAVVWCVVAAGGMAYIGRAIAERTWLLAYAQDLKSSDWVTVPMKNTIRMYKVRFILVANNLLFGIMSILNTLHLTHVPAFWLGWYVVVSLMMNEFVLIWLTIRDESMLQRFLPPRKHWWSRKKVKIGEDDGGLPS